MKKVASSSWIVLVGALFSPLPAALAERTIDETRSAEADGRVEIENVSGSVEVVGWDRAEVHVSGIVADDVERVAIDTGSKGTSISVVLPRRSNRGSADLRIEVPRGSRVTVSTVSADIQVRELSGAVDAESVSGNIEVAGAITAIEAESVSGDVKVASTVTLTSAKFETVSGDLELSGALAPDGRFRFESVSGDVALDLAGSGADLDVATFSGAIRGDVPRDLGRGHHDNGGTELVVGDGGAKVMVRTHSGSVEVKAGEADVRRR